MPPTAKRLTTGRHDKKLDLPQRHQRRGRAEVGFADAVANGIRLHRSQRVVKT
jgi:hypothetical protein